LSWDQVLFLENTNKIKTNFKIQILSIKETNLKIFNNFHRITQTFYEKINKIKYKKRKMITQTNKMIKQNKQKETKSF
jgi:hypothetical protein